MQRDAWSQPSMLTDGLTKQMKLYKPKKKVIQSDVSPTIIIPAAGLAKRMKSYGPKALIPCAKNEPLICRQIRLMRETFSNPNIIVVLGFGAERIRKVLPRGVRVVLNDEFANTNVAHSIRLGMAYCAPWLPLLIVYGDLVFNQHLLHSVDLYKSSVLIGEHDGREDEVGLTVVDKQVTCFSYGLATKWSQVVTLMYPEQCMFVELMSERHRRKHFGYEVLNEMLNRGCLLTTTSNNKIRLVEIDSSRDIHHARAIK